LFLSISITLHLISPGGGHHISVSSRANVCFRVCSNDEFPSGTRFAPFYQRQFFETQNDTQSSLQLLLSGVQTAGEQGASLIRVVPLVF
jgi:hypothetical protein